MHGDIRVFPGIVVIEAGSKSSGYCGHSSRLMDCEAGSGRLMAYGTKPGLMVETQKSGGCCQYYGVMAHLEDGDQNMLRG